MPTVLTYSVARPVVAIPNSGSSIHFADFSPSRPHESNHRSLFLIGAFYEGSSNVKRVIDQHYSEDGENQHDANYRFAVFT
jgi:hypothetical protein